jgi:hypothetical protein
MGYAECEAAQLEFFTRVKLLYDFGCEDDELVLLQGCVLLSCFQHSFDVVKESRYWFGNAVRLAKQLGVYRRYVRPASGIEWGMEGADVCGTGEVI